jgi:hypothetical protein
MCNLSKQTVKKRINWVSVDGGKFNYEKYSNLGERLVSGGQIGLPNSGYPYTIEYHEDYKFMCCRLCNCVDKIKIK